MSFVLVLPESEWGGHSKKESKFDQSRDFVLKTMGGWVAPSLQGLEVGLCLFIHSYGDRAGCGRLGKRELEVGE